MEYTAKNLTEKDKEMLAKVEKHHSDPNFWKTPPKKKIIPIHKREEITWKTDYEALPKKLELTSDEIEKRDNLVRLLKEAAEIVKKYIDKFKSDEEYKVVIEDLEGGLDNLVGRIDSIYAIDGWIVKHLLRPKHKRGGFGLSRGFSEFLRALPKEDQYWADEIMDAVHIIEDYYREM